MKTSHDPPFAFPIDALYLILPVRLKCGIRLSTLRSGCGSSGSRSESSSAEVLSSLPFPKAISDVIYCRLSMSGEGLGVVEEALDSDAGEWFPFMPPLLSFMVESIFRDHGFCILDASFPSGSTLKLSRSISPEIPPRNRISGAEVGSSAYTGGPTGLDLRTQATPTSRQRSQGRPPVHYRPIEYVSTLMNNGISARPKVFKLTNVLVSVHRWHGALEASRVLLRGLRVWRIRGRFSAHKAKGVSAYHKPGYL